MYEAKTLMQSLVTAQQRDCCSQLVDVTLHCPREKSAMRPFVKMFDPLVVIIVIIRIIIRIIVNSS